MKPTKAKDLIVSTAMELNLPVNIVNDSVTTYWKDVRGALSELKAPIVHVSAFGNFTIKHWILEKEKEKYLFMIDSIAQRGSKRSELIIEQLRNKLTYIEKMMDMCKSEMQRKEFIKIHRKRNYAKTNI